MEFFIRSVENIGLEPMTSSTKLLPVGSHRPRHKQVANPKLSMCREKFWCCVKSTAR